MAFWSRRTRLVAVPETSVRPVARRGQGITPSRGFPATWPLVASSAAAAPGEALTGLVARPIGLDPGAAASHQHPNRGVTVWNLTNDVTISTIAKLSDRVPDGELAVWCLAIVAVISACAWLCSPTQRHRRAAQAARNKDILHRMSLPLEPEDDDPDRRGALS
jgi:hypothetical protein